MKPDGTYAGFVPVGRAPTRCAFVGSELYVTDGGPSRYVGESRNGWRALANLAGRARGGLDLFQGHIGTRK